MSLSTDLRPVDSASAKQLCGMAEIVVVDSADAVIDRYRLLRYSGVLRGKNRELFAVKDSTDKFFVRSDRELGLSPESPFRAFMATDFDAIDLRD